jgi:hypothetical protein
MTNWWDRGEIRPATEQEKRYVLTLDTLAKPESIKRDKFSLYWIGYMGHEASTQALD